MFDEYTVETPFWNNCAEAIKCKFHCSIKLLVQNTALTHKISMLGSS